MQGGYWKVGNWKKIPLFLHWTVFLWIPWYLYHHRDLVDAALTFLAFVALLLVHELGHAAAAGVNRVPVYGIKLYLLHGECEHRQAYYEAEDLLIAWGGVLAQLAVLVVALGARFSLARLAPELEHHLAPFFYVFIGANAVIIAFNLIPVAPLDGAKAWGVIPYFRPRILARARQAGRSFVRALDVKQRKATRRASERAAAELMDRLMKNKD